MVFMEGLLGNSSISPKRIWHRNKPQKFWNSILWTDETKLEMCGNHPQHHVWQKTNTTYHHNHLIPTVKLSEGA